VKAEATPYWGILVAGALGGVWWLTHYDFVEFDEANFLQFSRPQVEKDASRVGRRISTLTVEDLTPGDLVRFKTTRTRTWTLTARVIAKEGQRVRIDGKTVYVNGEKAPDEFARSLSEQDYYPDLIVPRNCVFVLNDQRWGHGADRCDSRALGPIPIYAIDHRFSPKEKRNAPRSRLK